MQISQWRYQEPLVAILEDRLSEFTGMESQAHRTYEAVTTQSQVLLLPKMY